MSDNDPGWTLGALQRTCRGATLLLHHLGNDRRVLAAFDTWCGHRGITIERLQRMWDGTAADREDLVRVAWAHPEETHAMVEAFVREELKSDLPWLPSALSQTFRLWGENCARRERRRVPSLSPDDQSQALLPPGRGPRAEFERDIAWFYRSRLQDPPDPPTVLLAEWKKQHPTTTSQPSLVSNAITRVYDWLNVPIHFPWDEPAS